MGIPGIALAIKTFHDYVKRHPHVHALVVDEVGGKVHTCSTEQVIECCRFLQELLLAMETSAWHCINSFCIAL